MFILNSIAPIFLLIAFGKILQKFEVFPDSFFKGLNRFVYWIALPALLVSNISTAEIDFLAVSKILTLLIAGTLLSMLLAWMISRHLKLPAPSRGSFIQGSFRGNGAFVGLPVIIYSLGSIDADAAMLGTVMLAPIVIIFNVLSVSALLHYGGDKHSTGHSAAVFTGQLLKNPLIISCMLGLTLNLLSLHFPLFITRPLDALGGAALPLILISIGASLEVERLKGTASPTLIASLLKTMATPVIGFLLAPLLHLDNTQRMIAVLYLACPTAGMSYVMAEVMNNDATLAGRIVALSTLLSAITIPIIIAIGL